MRLKGLKIARNKAGRYFVYIRGTKIAILKNFEGDRAALLKRLSEPDMLMLYNAHRKRDLNRVYAEGTLGSLVAWFRAECPRYDKLAELPAKTMTLRSIGLRAASTARWS